MSSKEAVRPVVVEASATRPRDHAGVWIPPPLLYVAVFLVGVLLERLFPLSLLPDTVTGFGGAVLIAAGAALSFWSAALLRSRRTSVIPIRPTTTLVVDGPYRVSRNPMYLGLVVVFMGVALVMQVLWAILLIPVLVLLVTVTVTRKEEAYLEQKFGADYLDYRATVRRWV